MPDRPAEWWSSWPPMPPLVDPACRRPGIDRAWFFPSRGEPAGLAQAVCRSCVDRAACLAFALSAGQRLSGVWGGSTGAQRRQMLADAHRSDDAVKMDLVDLELAPEPPTTNGNGEAKPANEPKRCVGCDTDLSGRAESTKWCSQACRQKSRRSVDPQTAPRPRRTTQVVSAAPAGPVDVLGLVERLLAGPLEGAEVELRSANLRVTVTAR